LSQPFAEWLLPLIKSHFPDFPQRSAAELYQAENVMKTPSLIRVEADEVMPARGRVSPHGAVHEAQPCDDR
jgi:Zn-dependent M32 family carboxypeptidase